MWQEISLVPRDKSFFPYFCRKFKQHKINIMKRNLIGAIVLIAALAFAGCNNKKQKEEVKEEAMTAVKSMRTLATLNGRRVRKILVMRIVWG